MQQWSLLRDKGIPHPNPRRQFYRDLDAVLTTLRSQNHSIILAGDFNESIGDDDCLDRLITKHNLCNSIACRPGPYTTTTYSRGSKCLDYIFITPDLVPSIRQCGILPVDSIFTSDHRTVYLDINPSISLGSHIASLWSPASRRLQPRNVNLHDDYISHLYTMLSNHNVFDRAARLDNFCRTHSSDTSPTTTSSSHLSLDDAIRLAESIDRDVT